jgi:hypothetical protein
MASRTFPGTPRNLDRSVIELFGRFTGAGASAITGVDCLGFTIARTGVGLFTITLDDQYPLSEAAPDGSTTKPLLFIGSSIIAAAATSGQLEGIVDSSYLAAKTITARWAVAAAAADVAVGEIVMVRLVLRNTSTPRNGA